MAHRIVIDAGHGGKDPGAVNGKLYEKTAVLAIAKKVRKKLTDEGYSVKMTRSGDVFVSLANRCSTSNNWNADLFISIHLNSAANKEASGVEVWRYETVGTRTKKLAENVQGEIVSALGWKDRGVKTTKTLYVLKRTNASAVLIECGFLSNDKEGKNLFKAAYQEKIANAVFRAVEKTLKK